MRMRRLVTPIVPWILAVLTWSAPGCKGSGDATDPTPEPNTLDEPVTDHEPATEAQPTPAEEASPAPGDLSDTLAAAVRGIPGGNPDPDLSGADLEAGRRTYEGLCASCHGPGGKGDGPAAASLNPPPGDWTHPDGHARTSLSQKAWLIAHGVGGGSAMPPFEAALSEAQILGVLAVVQSFGPQAGRAPEPEAGEPEG